VSAAGKAPSPAPPRPAPPAKGAPRVHIETDEPGVRLLRIDGVISDDLGEAILTRTACTAPCDQIIDGRKGQMFFVGAPDMVPSRGFRLNEHSGELTARVDAGSMAARQGGFLLAGFGGAALIGGVVMLGFGYGGAASTSGGKVVDTRNQAATTGGFIALGAGAALVATGIVLVLTSRTSVDLVPGSARSAGVRLDRGRVLF
jgi:hypothetical protein